MKKLAFTFAICFSVALFSQFAQADEINSENSVPKPPINFDCDLNVCAHG